MLKIVHSNIKPKSEKQQRKERIQKFVEILLAENNEPKKPSYEPKENLRRRER